MAFHGEGPVWSARWGGLRCVDMLAGDVLSLADDGTVTRRHVGTRRGRAAAPRGGGAVIGVERGFALEDAGRVRHAARPVWTDAGIRMNDGGCDPDGRFYCGSMAYDKQPGRGVALPARPGRRGHRRARRASPISNGLEWSPDGSLAYYNDTATHRIDVFDYDRDAGLTGRRPFVRLPDDGNPDGLTVDAEGGVWTALYGSGAVHRYAPDGALSEVIELPTPQVTACTFGGPRARPAVHHHDAGGPAARVGPAGRRAVPGRRRRPRRPAREFAG